MPFTCFLQNENSNAGGDLPHDWGIRSQGPITSTKRRPCSCH